MRCFVQTKLNATADSVWQAAKKPGTLLQVTRGLMGFANVDRFAAEWQPGQTIRTRLWFFHVIPGWTHTLTVTKIDESQEQLRSHEYSSFYTWDHTIHVQEDPPGCVYSDLIEIRAGLLTFLVWLYANIFYRYRQNRLRKLAPHLK